MQEVGRHCVGSPETTGPLLAVPVECLTLNPLRAIPLPKGVVRSEVAGEGAGAGVHPLDTRGPHGVGLRVVVATEGLSRP